MKDNLIKINWPNGKVSYENSEISWLEAAKKAGVEIPLGCKRGSCGACEIEVNGKTVKSCTVNIKSNKNKPIAVDFSNDIYW